MWLRATLSPFLAALTVAHEARHLWQYRHWDLLGANDSDREDDARRYQEEVFVIAANLVLGKSTRPGDHPAQPPSTR